MTFWRHRVLPSICSITTRVRGRCLLLRYHHVLVLFRFYRALSLPPCLACLSCVEGDCYALQAANVRPWR